MASVFLRRAASILIVVSLLLTSFTGILFLGGDTARSEAGVLYDDDTTINDVKNMTNVIMTANLVIGKGGVVTVDHGSLIFSQSALSNEQFTLIIEDGGKLILKNATLTTQMDNLKAFPSLGVMVRNNGTIEAYDSNMTFSGHMVVDNSNLVLWRSMIKGFSSTVIDKYCNENSFPSEVFATSPALLFVSANVGLYDNSGIEDIYEQGVWDPLVDYNSIYSHTYPFATDINNATGSKENVRYSLNRMPSGPAANTTVVGETFTNLTTDDNTFYKIDGNANLWLDGFDTAGLVFNVSQGIAPILSIKYKTDQNFPTNGGYIYYQYRNGTVVRSATQLNNTYDHSSATSKEVVATVNLSIMSSLDLYGLKIGYENVPTHSVSINKVWTTLSYQMPTYTNVILAGSTSLTVINSYLGVDFSNKTSDHNQLILTDNSKAEMYGVSVDTEQNPDPLAGRLPAFVTIEKTIEVTPFSIGVNDTSVQNIGAVTALDGAYYSLASTNTGEFNQFNISGLNGSISSAIMKLSYVTEDGPPNYDSNGYLQFSLADGLYKNTTINVVRSSGALNTIQYLLPNEITELQQIGNMGAKITKNQAIGILHMDKLWMDVTLRPTIHIYRWADITAVDTQALPVNGAVVSFTNPAPVYYVSGQAQAVPPVDVLRYLGVSETDFFKTDASGKAAIPLLADTIYQTSSNPNSRPTSTYNVELSYLKDAVTYYGHGNISFMNPYPNLNPVHMRSAANILLNGLVLDQVIIVNEIRPDVFFPEGINITNAGSAVNHSGQGETVVISTIAGNAGNSPAMATEFVFYAKGADNQQVILGSVKKDVGVGQSVVVNMTWLINVTMGNYSIVINANPEHLIDDSNITNDQVSVDFIIDAPNAGVVIGQLDIRTYAPGTNMLVTGRVANQNTSDPIAGAKITVYLAQNGVQKGAAFTGITDANGNFKVSLYIPEGLDGDYQVHASVTIGDKTTSGLKNVTIEAAAEGGVPWYLYLIILAVIAAAILFFSAWLYKYGLGKMVECGECGSLIPDSSKRCPKCGVEFEVGTAKCSECGAWIPSNSTSCPECNAKFITDAIEEEEDAYLKKMREQYDAYVDTFREEARKILGKKYSDAKFPDWWKKQPSYVSFESWLSQEEEKRKVGGTACSSCGTLNPRGSTICHKCGSTLEMPKVEAAPSEEQKADAQQPKPLRRIVRRQVEKKAEAKPDDKPVEEPRPEENKPQN